MKRLVQFGIICIFLGIIFMYKDELLEIYNKIVFLFKDDDKIQTNEYYRDYDFLVVKNTKITSPTNKQDLYNLYYTVINSGSLEYSFYCDTNYKSCLDDVKDIANSRVTLSDINNLVHPYNSFQHIETEYNNSGKITIKLSHTYSSQDIITIDKKIDEIIAKLSLNANLSDVEKIRKFHDYIIENSIYDTDRSDNNIINYRSDMAYGPLIEGYGICGGYSDAMELFLERMGLESYKVSTNSHVWNAVLINGNWLNLDLTWDDPITSNGTNVVDYKFFLIDTKKMLELEPTQHSFNTEFYKELAD